MIRTLFSICIGLSVVTAVSAQTDGYKGVPFGAGKTELLHAFPSLKCEATMRLTKSLGDEICRHDTNYKYDASVAKLHSYGGQPALDAFFSIIDGKFEAFRLQFSPSKYGPLKQALAEAGVKGKEEARTLQTGGGATLSSRVFKLADPKGSATIYEHCGSIDAGCVGGQSSAFDAYVTKLNSGEVKAGAKDF